MAGTFDSTKKKPPTEIDAMSSADPGQRAARTQLRGKAYDEQRAMLSPKQQGMSDTEVLEETGLATTVAKHAQYRAEQLRGIGEFSSDAIAYVDHYKAAQQMVQAHSKMAADIGQMKRGVDALQQATKSAKGAQAVKAAAKLAEAKKAYEAARQAFRAERSAVTAAHKFLTDYKQYLSLRKGKLMVRFGEVAGRLQIALGNSPIGAKLLKTGKILASKPVVRGLTIVGSAMAGLHGYLDSPTSTKGGKATNAALAAGGGALVMANPWVAGADLFIPKGYKVAEVYGGGAAALSSIAEGVATGDTSAMDRFHKLSKKGHYGKVMQAASKAGDFWAEKGIAGGLKEFAESLKWWMNR